MKIYTFEIYFNDNDSTQFCAETEQEALQLFNQEFFDKDELPPVINGVEVVFDADDAREYGADYGTPAEYYATRLTPVNYDCIDILEDLNMDEVVYDYAEKVYAREDYSSADSFLQNVLAIEFFPDVTFHYLLQRYYEEQNKDIADEVRGYVPYKQGFLMTHGVGYSWESADLFGGTADGRAKPAFINWLTKNGYTLVTSDNY